MEEQRYRSGEIYPNAVWPVTGTTITRHERSRMVVAGTQRTRIVRSKPTSPSRGCGCRLAKGLHGYRLVFLDVEDGI